MEILVDSLPAAIEIGATGGTEIAQNVRTILRTPRGTVPLDRSFGVADDLLDLPLPVAQAKYSGEIVKEIEKQEPRVKVLSVTYKDDLSGAMEGKLIPVVKLKIIGDV